MCEKKYSKYEKNIILEKIKYNVEPDLEDYYLAEIESKSNTLDKLQDYLIYKQGLMKQEVKSLEKRRRNLSRDSFYYSSFQRKIHSLNAERRLISDIQKFISSDGEKST